MRKKLCDKNRIIRKPWDTFTQDAHTALENVVVSFKNYIRVINKATNYYEKYDKNGKKEIAEQKGQDMWAIRKPMHKETVFGQVNLRRKVTIKLKDALEKIPAICDKELRDYINILVAKQFNKKQILAHFKSINYRLNETGNKTSKFVEAQKGTNLYFAIYEDKEGNRSYNTIPLNEVIERLKQGLSPAEDLNKQGEKLKFYLSPNDLVYVPTEEEKLSSECKLNKEQIYKIVSSTGSECYFIPYTVSNVIFNKVEFESLNKMGRALTGEMIKSVCWKLELDRLGNILKVIK